MPDCRITQILKLHRENNWCCNFYLRSDWSFFLRHSGWFRGCPLEARRIMNFTGGWNIHQEIIRQIIAVAMGPKDIINWRTVFLHHLYVIVLTNEALKNPGSSIFHSRCVQIDFQWNFHKLFRFLTRRPRTGGPRWSPRITKPKRTKHALLNVKFRNWNLSCWICDILTNRSPS